MVCMFVIAGMVMAQDKAPGKLKVKQQRSILVEGVNNPSHITLDNGKVYIVDRETVKVFSLDGEILATFCKRGEGPGEVIVDPDLETYMGIHIGEKIITTFVHNKISIWKKSDYSHKEDKKVVDGSLLFHLSKIEQEYVTASIKVGGITKVGKTDYKHMYIGLELRDQNLVKRSKRINQFAMTGSKKRQIPAQLLFIDVDESKNHLYVLNQEEDGGVIKVYKVYNDSLILIEEIRIGPSRTKLEKKFKADFIERLGRVPFKQKSDSFGGAKNFFNKCFTVSNAPLGRILKVSNGTVLIQTYENKGSKSRYIFIDKNRQAYNVWLPNPNGLLQGNFCNWNFRYIDGEPIVDQITEDEDEEWEITTYTLEIVN